MKSTRSKQWQNAMLEEMYSLNKYNSWILTPKPSSSKIVDCKWIYKIKERKEWQVKIKLNLVNASWRGFTHVEGIDYSEILFPVIKYTTIRIISSSHFDRELEQLYAQTTILHGKWNHFYETTRRFWNEKFKGRKLVYLLHISLYGLKRIRRFDSFVQ